MNLITLFANIVVFNLTEVQLLEKLLDELCYLA